MVQDPKEVFAPSDQTRATLMDRLQQELALYRFVRNGLMRLGIDPAAARTLARNETRAREALAALSGRAAEALINDAGIQSDAVSPRLAFRA